MSTHVASLHHIVFATKHRRPTIAQPHRRELFAYIHGIIRNLKCTLYRLNGMDDHLHLLVGIHPSLSLSEFVKKIKLAAGEWMRKSTHFPAFDYWQEGYGAFTISWKDKNDVIEYIINQEEHHRGENSLAEFKRLLEASGLEWNAAYDE
ncbi:MAG: IS200/IS605 family transposase [Candidatus Sumerlaeia bacterium]|nr:IS200/IS605 family transposase [Candidatus Sumerlaeia bacterium]